MSPLLFSYTSNCTNCNSQNMRSEGDYLICKQCGRIHARKDLIMKVTL